MSGDKQAHLAMIQGIVSRLGQNSFLLKGWSVLLVSALLALGVSGSENAVLLVAFLPVVAFWGLDGYFLWQERLFRALYDQVRNEDESSIDYSMDVGRPALDRDASMTWFSSTVSRTLVWFHGVILLTVVVTYTVV